jgi:hypothetical protein
VLISGWSLKARELSRPGSDWAGCSSTIIGGQHELDRIFGHHEVLSFNLGDTLGI